jgi:elongation factor P--(R)-beta-lysine ligase
VKSKLEYWRPACTLERLKERAQTLRDVRAFFLHRGVLEVEAPVLGDAISPDAYVNTLTVPALGLALQPSPELYLKRCLASGLGDCYALGKVFRCDEPSARHNPEFTLLEWYRVNFTTQQLMDDVKALLTHLWGYQRFDVCSYDHLFQRFFNQSILGLCDQTLIDLVSTHLPLTEDFMASVRAMPSMAYDLLFSSVIEPTLGADCPVFVTDFPAIGQTTLAQYKKIGTFEVEDRFELFFRGLEIANGYQELSDAKELEKRLRHQQLEQQPGFQQLLAAQQSYFPSVSGVAVGMDRLLMAHFQAKHIEEVLPFPVHYMAKLDA